MISFLFLSLLIPTLNGEPRYVFDNVVILDSSNFTNYIENESSKTLVLFYDDSMESLGAIPQVQRAATIIGNKPEFSSINIAAFKHNPIDAECAVIEGKYKAQERPVLKYFQPNGIHKYLQDNVSDDIDTEFLGLNPSMINNVKSLLDYTSGKQERQIVNWLTEYNKPAMTTIETSKQLRHLKMNNEVLVFGLGYDKPDCLEAVILGEVAEMYRNTKKDSAANVKFSISYVSNNPTNDDLESINAHIEMVETFIHEIKDYASAFAVDHPALTGRELDERLQPLENYVTQLKRWKVKISSNSEDKESGDNEDSEDSEDSNTEDIESLEPMLLVIKKFDEQFVIAPANYKKGEFGQFFNVMDFVERERFPLIQELKAINYLISEERELGYVWVCIEYDKPDYVRRIKTYYNNIIAPRFKARLIFYIVDAHKYIEHIRWLGVPWIPGLMIQDHDRYKYLFDPTLSILDSDNVTQFFDDYENDDLARFIKSESYEDLIDMEISECEICSETCKDPSSVENGLYVENLNGHDLFDILQYHNIPQGSPYDKNCNILISYYAAWDTRSRKFLCEYEKVAKYFSRNSSIMIAKVDAGDNDITYGKVDEYPRFILYKYSEFEEYLINNGLPLDMTNYGNRPIDDESYPLNGDLSFMMNDPQSDNAEKSFYKWKGNLDAYSLPTDGGYGILYEGQRTPLGLIEFIEGELGIESVKFDDGKEMDGLSHEEIEGLQTQKRRQVSERKHSMRNFIDKQRNMPQKQRDSELLDGRQIEIDVDGNSIEVEASPEIIEKRRDFLIKQRIVGQLLQEKYSDEMLNVDPFYNSGKQDRD